MNGFIVNGGGTVSSNDMAVYASNITVDVDGLVDANELGHRPGMGRGPGQAPFNGNGGSGG